MNRETCSWFYKKFFDIRADASVSLAHLPLLLVEGYSRFHKQGRSIPALIREVGGHRIIGCDMRQMV